MRRYFALILIGFSTSLYAACKPATDPNEKNVLCLGNSYTSGPAHFLKTLFRNEAPEYKIEVISPGGKTLNYHLEARGSLDAIASRKWDVLVLQEQSLLPALSKDYTAQFQQAVAGLARKGRAREIPRIMLFQTWGRRDGHQQQRDVYTDFPTMHKKISGQYQRAATENKLEIAPVGEAFAILYQEDRDLFRNLYKGDGSHPSAHGNYLVACVFYGAITGHSPKEIRWRGDLQPEVAATLRNAAARALANKNSVRNR